VNLPIKNGDFPYFFGMFTRGVIPRKEQLLYKKTMNSQPKIPAIFQPNSSSLADEFPT